MRLKLIGFSLFLALLAGNVMAEFVPWGMWQKSVPVVYQTWTNDYMSYRTVWHDYQSNSTTIAYDHNPNFPLDATNLPAGSEPVATNIGVNALGVVDYAYLFDGVNDYQQMADSRATELWLYDFTVTAWVKLLSIKNKYCVIIEDRGTSGIAQWNLAVQATNVYWYFQAVDGGSDQAFASSGNALPTNEWIHVAGVRKDITNVYFYTNGVLAGAASNSALGSVDTYPAPAPMIGKSPSAVGAEFPGYIDNVNTYLRAFSVADITNEVWNTDHRGINLLGNMESTNRNWSDITVPLMGLNMRSITGTQINDYTVNGHNATNYNATTEVTGTNEHNVINYAMRFNATNEYIDCGSIIPEISTASDLTICFWLNKNCLTNNGDLFCVSDASDAADYFGIWVSGAGGATEYGKLTYYLAWNTSQKILAETTSPVLTSNENYFVAVVLGTGGNRMFINTDTVALTHTGGTAATTNTASGITGLDDIRIGGVRIGSLDYNKADGAITDFLIFTKGLSTAELRLISQWTKPANNLKVY